LKAEAVGAATLRDFPETGVVVPCYNEARRLPAEKFKAFCRERPWVHFCFVNDGSSDGTLDVLRKIKNDFPKQVSVDDLGENRGKGEAVRAGVKQLCKAGGFAFIGYWDADLSTPLDEIPRFLDVAREHPGVEFLCGSRIRRMGAVVERKPHRHYLGRVFATATSLLLHLGVYDTQCGAKLFTAKLAERIFDEPFLSWWFFDVELFARTIAMVGLEEAQRAIFEVPVREWREREGSKRTPLTYLRAPVDLLRIHGHYKLKK